MSPSTIPCPHCNTELSSEGLGLYERVVCPSCNTPFRANTRLGAYEMVSELGIGGMSVVLKARDIVLGRELALKILNETYRNDPQRIARFQRECALMAKVRHAHVARVYAAGAQNDYCYIAMELIDGSNVESDIEQYGALDPSEALRIIRQVAEGLQAAWKAGMLHRDMKPANILLTAEREAKVVDFGLALLSSESDTEEMVWATPYYAAPETLMRKKEDARADIYSLGMTLRHMLTGSPPFDPGITTIHTLLTIKRKLSSIRLDAPWLPVSLCDLVDHMTAFSVWKRPRDYAVLLREMKETADLIEQTATDPDALKAHTPTWRRKRMRQRVLFPAIIAAFILLLFIPQAIDFSNQPAARHAAASLKPATPILSEQDNPILKAEQAVAAGQIDKAAELFEELGRRTISSIRAWSILHAYICLTLLNEEERIEKLLATDALSLSVVPAPGSETIQCIFEFMRKLATGQDQDYTPRANQNNDLTASVELASGMTQLRGGHARKAHSHLEHALQLLQKPTRTPYDGYVTRIEPLIPGLKKLAELEELPEQTAEEKGNKARRILSFWDGEGTFLPWLCRSAFCNSMLEHAEKLQSEASVAAPRENVLSKLSTGQYAEAARLFNDGSYPPSPGKRKALSEMCETAERFCRLVQLSFTEDGLKHISTLQTMTGRQFAPSDISRFGQGSFWFGDGSSISIRELDPASLVSLYAALGTTNDSRGAKAREMQIVLTYLHGKEDEAKRLFAEGLQKNPGRQSPFISLWQQWMDAADGKSL